MSSLIHDNFMGQLPGVRSQRGFLLYYKTPDLCIVYVHHDGAFIFNQCPFDCEENEVNKGEESDTKTTKTTQSTQTDTQVIWTWDSVSAPLGKFQMPDNYDLPDDLIQQYVSEVKSHKVEKAPTDPGGNKENEAGKTSKSKGSARSLKRLLDHNGRGERDHGIAEPVFVFVKRTRRKTIGNPPPS